MREITFAKKNHDRWQTTEQLLKDSKTTSPDTLARLYVELTDDLAYAQTFYPGSKTTNYLNQLTSSAHQKLYKVEKKNRGWVINFFKSTYPNLIYAYRKELAYAFIVFVISVVIGLLSAKSNPDFVRLILGQNYIEETKNNIVNGDPMGIYGSHSQWDMFFMITWNNIRVSFIAFALGITAGIGTFFVLFRNGVMLGAFSYFFVERDLTIESMSAIWMHGTIEIFSIVVAGGAGFVIARGMLFPGTYPRVHSFVKAGREGAKIIGGLIPFFIMAGFIESFFTRHYQNHFLSTAVITISILLIVTYYIVYPIYLTKTNNNESIKFT
jgi:uncharacterized membrane protein SpoIIM required for sporulation